MKLVEERRGNGLFLFWEKKWDGNGFVFFDRRSRFSGEIRKCDFFCGRRDDGESEKVIGNFIWVVNDLLVKE